MTKEQCFKCVYSAKCDTILHLKSSVLNMRCGQDRSKAKKAKPRTPKVKVAIDPAVESKGDSTCTPQKS